MRRLLRLSGLFAILAFVVSNAHAALRVVPDQYPTVQSAIVASASGDSIQIRAGSYSGPFVLAGKDLTVFGAGSGATVLTGNQATRVLEIGAGVTDLTVISELLIRDGRADEGGGVLVTNGATPRFAGCVFLSNRAFAISSFGGAVVVRNSSRVEFTDCQFFANSASIDLATGNQGYGGAVAARSSSRVVARRCRFEDNTAAGFEGGAGGAVYLDFASLDSDFDECRFDDNFAGVGGAIGGRSANVRRCSFRGNYGTYGASAIGLQNDSVDPIDISENLLWDNILFGGSATIDVRGPAAIRNNTLAYNRSGSGGAIWRHDDNQIENNLIAFNDAVGIDCLGGSAGIACNDVWENTREGVPANYAGACGDLTGIDGNLSEDPLFCDGPARRLDLQSSSPCAETGSCGLIGALPSGCATSGVSPASSRLELALPRPHPVVLPARLSFSLPRASHAALDLYDVNGRRIANLASGSFRAGRHEIEWAPADRVKPGVYVIALTTGSERTTRRVIVTR